MKITTVVELKAKDIADLMVTVVEGGSQYWCDKLLFRKAFKEGVEIKAKDTPWYSDSTLYEDGVELFLEVEYNEGRLLIITEKDFKKGFELLSEFYPSRLMSIVAENYDAEDADVWFQHVCFGEIVYG